MPRRYNDATAQVIGYAKGVQGHAATIQKNAVEFDQDYTSETQWDGVIMELWAIEDKVNSMKRAAIEEKSRCKQLALKMAEAVADHDRARATG